MADFKLNILQETEDFLVINKQKGLIVNNSATVQDKTLQQLVAPFVNLKPSKKGTKLSRDKQEFYDKGGIVHRLDKDTSGVIVVAKNPKFYVKLKKQFLNHKVDKTYTAVTFNDLTPFFNQKEYIKVNLPLGRNPTNRHQFAVIQGGRPAQSDIYLKTTFNANKIEPTTHFAGQEFSIIKVKPKTGRTHQIRVHCKALNAEVLGDAVYCGRKQKSFANKYKAPLMLHARELSFLDYNFRAPYSDNFVSIVNKFWGA